MNEENNNKENDHQPNEVVDIYTMDHIKIKDVTNNQELVNKRG